MHQSAAKSPSQEGWSLSTIFSKKEQFVTSSNSTFVVRRDHAKNICGQARTCEKAKRRERTDAKRGKIEGYAVHQGRSRTDKEFNALQMWNQHRTDTMQCTLQNEQGWISPRRSREGLNDPKFRWIAFRLPTQAACTISAASQGQTDPSRAPFCFSTDWRLQQNSINPRP